MANTAISGEDKSKDRSQSPFGVLILDFINPPAFQVRNFIIGCEVVWSVGERYGTGGKTGE